jgi:predicted lipid-binding transport protein (Tim44 family)
MRLKTVLVVLIMLAASASPALACPSCFGAADGPMASGLNAGIAVLLGVTGVVLAGFAAGIIAFVRRVRTLERMEDHA